VQSGSRNLASHTFHISGQLLLNSIMIHDIEKWAMVWVGHKDEAIIRLRNVFMRWVFPRKWVSFYYHVCGRNDPCSQFIDRVDVIAWVDTYQTDSHSNNSCVKYAFGLAVLWVNVYDPLSGLFRWIWRWFWQLAIQQNSHLSLGVPPIISLHMCLIIGHQVGASSLLFSSLLYFTCDSLSWSSFTHPYSSPSFTHPLFFPFFYPPLFFPIL